MRVAVLICCSLIAVAAGRAEAQTAMADFVFTDPISDKPFAVVALPDPIPAETFSFVFREVDGEALAGSYDYEQLDGYICHNAHSMPTICGPTGAAEAALPLRLSDGALLQHERLGDTDRYTVSFGSESADFADFTNGRLERFGIINSGGIYFSYDRVSQ